MVARLATYNHETRLCFDYETQSCFALLSIACLFQNKFQIVSPFHLEEKKYFLHNFVDYKQNISHRNYYRLVKICDNSKIGMYRRIFWKLRANNYKIFSKFDSLSSLPTLQLHFLKSAMHTFQKCLLIYINF